MFLIDDDKAQVLEGCEEGRSGADHDLAVALSGAVDLVSSLSL